MIWFQNEILFPCEQWFSKSRGDKKIKRSLYPKGMSMEQIEAAEKGKAVKIMRCNFEVIITVQSGRFVFYRLPTFSLLLAKCNVD